jgi:TatA/E family protein of Tat protein translocase
MGMSATHAIMLLVVVILLFGRNKISGVMSDLAQGIKSFKNGLRDDEMIQDANTRLTVKAKERSTTNRSVVESDE